MLIAPSRVEESQSEADGLELAISLTAHELRAPLVAIRTVVERLLYAPATADEQRSLLEEGARELDRLARLTDVLLLWAHGTVPLSLDRIDLVSIVEGCVEEVQREQPGRSISLVAPTRLGLKADLTHIRVAIVNVLRNALSYSPCDTPVEVSVGRSSRSAIIRVRDHGAGIATDDRPGLFEPLVRGRLGRTHAAGGAGLGLFIARRIVEAHGGAISAESDGSGTVFRLDVPTRAATVTL